MIITSGRKDCLQEVIKRGVEDCAMSRVPHLLLLDTAFYLAEMALPLARWALLWYNKQVASVRRGPWPLGWQVSVSEPPSDLESGLCQWMQTGEEGPGLKEYLQAVDGERPMAMLNLCRKWIRALIPHVLSKRNRVDYGLLSNEDAMRLSRIAYEEEQQRTGKATDPSEEDLVKIKRLSRELLAVPFVGKDTPSRFSEFAQPEVIIGLTAAAYRIEGLRSRDVRRLFEGMQKDFSKATNPIAKRPQRILLERWKALAAASWASLNRNEFGEFPTVPPLELLQINDASHLSIVSSALRLLPAAITEYTVAVAFSLTQHDVKSSGGYALKKLSASGMDLGSDSLFETCIGFSGTPSDLIPRAMRGEVGCIPEKGTDAKVINTMLDPKTVSLHIVDRSVEVRQRVGRG